MAELPADSGDARAWRRWVVTFAASFFGLIALLLAAIILIDPYDAGYFPSIIGPGAVDNNEYTNHASRARDPRFDAAIFGNSHGQLLNPTVLSKATGLALVQLYARGTGPADQMHMMNFFLHHHPRARGIVLVADTFWCTHDAALPPPVDIPFPAWLYSNDRVVYLAHMLNVRMTKRMYLRVMMALGRVEAANPDGFSDYESGKAWSFQPTVPADAGATQASSGPIRPDTSFPAIDRFDRMISTMPAETAVAIVMPPVFHTYLPAPGSAAAADLRACKDLLTRSAGRRPNGAFLDFMTDSEISREPRNFMDVDHMRSNVAHVIESRLAAALAAPARPVGTSP